jgi:hypothetical protein
MARIGKACPGDCSKCEMLLDGEVDMIPCILDQIFQGQKRQEAFNKELSERISMLEMQSIPALASIDDNMQNVDATLLDEITEDYKPTKK